MKKEQFKGNVENKKEKCYIIGQGEKGITLVALVVTIIVLLILAGIAISLSLGNNGLFSRSRNAANTWKKAEANEQEEMKNFEGLYDNVVNNLGLNGVGDSESRPKPVEEIKGDETTNTEVIDKNGEKAFVPAGFIVDKEANTVEGGLVVIDNTEGDTKGNEFVWIPCTLDGANGSIKYDRYAFSKNGWNYRQTKLNDKDGDGSYKIERFSQKPYYYHEAMLEGESVSVEKYGGFYIGRYEVGCNVERNEKSKEEKGKVQKGLLVYNYITREGAKNVAEGMYTGKSKLCSSYAWDTTLQFIGVEYALNSESGNYSNDGLLKTGTTESEKNIYDMGGNAWEWTTEYYTYPSKDATFRGGNYSNNASDGPASIRSYTSESDANYGSGFRITLYL